MNENFLLDSWQAIGTSIDDFKTTIKEVADSTEFISPINSSDLTVLSFSRVDKDGKLAFYSLDPMKSIAEDEKISSVDIMRLNTTSLKAKYGDFNALIKEAQNEIGVLLLYGNKCSFVSKKVLTTCLQPFGLTGSFLGEKSFERDLLIARTFGKKKLYRTLVARNCNGLTKVFSILGERYKHLPQDILVMIYDELTKGNIMGRAECRNWEITHFMTGIQIEFPEKADEFQTLYGLSEKIIPGIILQTSDTGDCSVKIKSTWRVRGSVSIHAEVSKKHTGGLSVEKLLEETDAEIFTEYIKLPEKLCDLMALNITDPSWKLNKPSGQTKNRKIIESTLKSAFRQLKIVAAIGKTAEKSLFEQLLAEFDNEIAYTAYDFALSLMTLPERVSGLHPLLQEKLAKAVSKAPYIKYEPKIAPTVVLTA